MAQIKQPPAVPASIMGTSSGPSCSSCAEGDGPAPTLEIMEEDSGLAWPSPGYCSHLLGGLTQQMGDARPHTYTTLPFI